MPERIDQYGESLIGPPTYAEWLSGQIGDLLLREGSHGPNDEGDAHLLFMEQGNTTVRIRDYWNFMHKDNDPSVSNIKARNDKFYQNGFTPVLSVDITVISDVGRQDTEQAYHFFRPRDIFPNGGFSDIFLGELNENQHNASDVYALSRKSRETTVIRNPGDYPQLLELQEMILAHSAKA